MSQSLNNYIIRASIFLLLVFVIVVLLYPVLQNAFLSNIFINIIILLSLIIGLIFNFYHLINLNYKFISLSNFNITNSLESFVNLRGSDKNITLELKNLVLHHYLILLNCHKVISLKKCWISVDILIPILSKKPLSKLYSPLI